MGYSIGIDLDSTLNCLNLKWLELYNRDYNDNLQLKDVKNWHWERIVKTECGMKIYDYLSHPKLFYELEVQDNAQEVTRHLLDKGHNLYVVTAIKIYSSDLVMDKVDWIKKYFPHILEENIIFCNNKGRFNGDYLIDDGAHNIEAFAEANPNGTGLLLDYPYNQYVKDRYTRVNNWLEIKDYFSKI